MSERYKGFLVSLDRDIREDDAEYTINAIKMIKGVINVQPVTAECQDEIIKNRIKRELQDKIWKIFD